jgi:predicted amidophosphoribosyltransferase
MPIITALGRLLRPPDCLACGAADAWPCCAACLPSEPAGPGPWRLAADPGVTLWALGPYGDALRAAILAGKFRGQPAALHALGRRLGATLVAAGIGVDLVTWVAARPARGLPRDHADQTAAGVAAALDVPLAALLAPAPGRDLGRARRDADDPDRVAGAAAWIADRPPPRCRRRLAGGRVLVVDDIATTGRTLAGAAGVVRRAGARTVEVAVIAAARTAFGPPGHPAPPNRRLALRPEAPRPPPGRGTARDPPGSVSPRDPTAPGFPYSSPRPRVPRASPDVASPGAVSLPFFPIAGGGNRRAFLRRIASFGR